MLAQAREFHVRTPPRQAQSSKGPCHHTPDTYRYLGPQNQGHALPYHGYDCVILS